MIHMNRCRTDFVGTVAKTNDTVIREALVRRLNKEYAQSNYRIIPELGIWHGVARIDVAVVNGILHGFEIKSDKDTLVRLSEQRDVYNSVFDKVTLVVGSTHLIEAFKKIPEWWGVETARMDQCGVVTFNTIRESNYNPHQDEISIARLLWKHEALDLLESIGKADGVRSKPRDAIYARLAESLELEALKKYVRNALQYSRQDWRSGVQLV
jgi:hypothetical protein